MFTIFIDDSGTSPSQAVAIASALIIPARRIVALDREWDTFRRKEEFTSFHTSECLACNEKSEFADWDKDKQEKVTSRIGQIIKKYGVKAMSYAIKKTDFDEVVPAEIRANGGKFHYTWAVRNLIRMTDRWYETTNRDFPIEYVFDRTERRSRREIESVMSQADPIEGGAHSNYSFKNREEVPALQCTDFMAWTCFQFMRSRLTGLTIYPIAENSFWEFDRHREKTWMWAITQTRKQLESWVAKEQRSGESLRSFQQWQLRQEGKKREENKRIR